MSILSCFYPDEYLDSTYVIDFDALYRAGYRGVIFDIDNTLVPHGAPADERARALFCHLKEIGFDCCLLSNNQLPRIELFNQDIHVKFIENAHKPSVKNYRKSDADDGHKYGKYAVCGRSALYGCVWCTSYRYPFHPCEADSSEGGDPDCAEAVSGADRAAFL